MSSTNNLRPYYDHDTFNAGYSVIYKPGVGLIDTATNRPINATLTSSILNKTKQGNMSPGRGIGLSGFDNGVSNNLSDKNYVYDLEFNEYFDFGNFTELFKNLIWNFFKNYCKTLFMQPFEMVRLVLQVGSFELNSKSKKTAKRRVSSSPSVGSTSFIIDAESDDEINYFQSSNEWVPKGGKHEEEKRIDLSTSDVSTKIQPVSKHTKDIMSAIITQDGPFALFRGINASFIYQTLSHTIEAWITGFVSPFLGIPDPFFLDLTRSTDPLRSMWLSVAACVLTGLVLMPLDLIKVRLMITRFEKTIINESTLEESEIVPPKKKISRRSIRASILNYPIHYLIKPPPSVTVLTVLYQFATTIFRKSAPYFLFIRYNIDSYSSPNLYTIVNLLLLILEFFIKLPVENLLRKEQVKFLLQPKSIAEDEMRVLTIDSPDDLVIDFNESWEQDSSKQISLVDRFKKLALFDGWRVGVLNVIGFWGYNILKNDGGYLKAERL